MIKMLLLHVLCVSFVLVMLRLPQGHINGPCTDIMDVQAVLIQVIVGSS